MEKVVTKKYVESKVIEGYEKEEVIYRASDGKEFSLEYLCKNHEEELVWDSSISHIKKICYDGYTSYFDNTYYYVENNKDFDLLKKYYNHKGDAHISNFQKEGWVVLKFQDGGDYPDDYYLEYFEWVEQDIEDLKIKMAETKGE